MLVAVVLLGPVVVDANNTVSGGVKATVAAVSAAPPAAVQWGALAAEQCTFATSPNGILFIHFHIPKSGGSTVSGSIGSSVNGMLSECMMTCVNARIAPSMHECTNKWRVRALTQWPLLLRCVEPLNFLGCLQVFTWINPRC